MTEGVFVTVREGKLRGVYERHQRPKFEYFAFRGIPYAKPPLGELRFKDPEPPKPWSDVLDVSKFGENSTTMVTDFRRNPQGRENCLYLNVYSTNLDQQTKLAVMVWIHGGAFNFGSDNYDIYGPDYILDRNVVLVTINYRYGVFGFLNLGNEIAPGNQGLKDALMALRWVRDNISNFGGDPGNVTIFGQGFGGCMVHYLAMCPKAEGLFHKAISQSGTAANTWAYSNSCMNMSFRLVKELLGPTIVDLNEVARLLKLIDSREIVLAAERILTTNEQRQLIMPFVPSLDYGVLNPFFTEHPIEMLRRGVKVPFIVGFTSFEGSAFVIDMDDEALNEVNSDFASVIHPRILLTLWEKSITVEDLRFRYFGNEPVSWKTIRQYIDFIGDMHFYRGIFETASIQTQLGHPSTYMYHFEYDSDTSIVKALLKVDIPGTTYGEEIFYLFRPKLSKPMRNCRRLNTHMYLEKLDIKKYITQMWTDFAKTGDPMPITSPSIPIKWTPLERKNQFHCLIINETFRIATKEKKDLRFLEIL